MAVDTKSTRRDAARLDRKSVNLYQVNSCGDTDDTNILDFHTWGLHKNLVAQWFRSETKVPLCQYHHACIRQPASLLPKTPTLCGSSAGPRFDADCHLSDPVAARQPQNATVSDVISTIEIRNIKVNYPGSNNYTQFAYDGMGNRVQIVETVGGTTTSTRQFIFAQGGMCEIRDSSGTVVDRLFRLGESISGANYFFSFDQLKSIRTLSDSTGTVQATHCATINRTQAETVAPLKIVPMSEFAEGRFTCQNE
jgi:hypothetical protein